MPTTWFIALLVITISAKFLNPGNLFKEYDTTVHGTCRHSYTPEDCCLAYSIPRVRGNHEPFLHQ